MVSEPLRAPRGVPPEGTTADNPFGLHEGELVYLTWNHLHADSMHVHDGLHRVVATHSTDGGYTPGNLVFAPVDREVSGIACGTDRRGIFLVRTPMVTGIFTPTPAEAADYGAVS